jgi:hypothetical protein
MPRMPGNPLKSAAGRAKGAAKRNAPLQMLSNYVMRVSKMLGGSKARAYKSCIFGTTVARPKPGHVARCNRQFFGSPTVKVKGKRRKGRSLTPGAKGARIRKGRGGKIQSRRSGAGPGQVGAAKKRRRTEGR